MICKKCGRETSDDARFCPFCGEPTSNQTSNDTSKADLNTKIDSSTESSSSSQVNTQTSNDKAPEQQAGISRTAKIILIVLVSLAVVAAGVAIGVNINSYQNNQATQSTQTEPAEDQGENEPSNPSDNNQDESNDTSNSANKSDDTSSSNSSSSANPQTLSKVATDYNAAITSMQNATSYCLHDITGDGTPELFVKDNEGDIYVYTETSVGAVSIPGQAPGFTTYPNLHHRYDLIFFDQSDKWGGIGIYTKNPSDGYDADFMEYDFYNGHINLPGGVTEGLVRNSDGSYSIREYNGSLGARGQITTWTPASDRTAVNKL